MAFVIDRPGEWGVVVRVTSMCDGYEHLVADEVMTPGSAGRYVALCGQGMWAAGLACPAGPPCPGCLKIRRAAVAERGRTRQAGVWARLVARLRQARVRGQHRRVHRRRRR
jgi:hypothetical protein